VDGEKKKEPHAGHEGKGKGSAREWTKAGEARFNEAEENVSLKRPLRFQPPGGVVL